MNHVIYIYTKKILNLNSLCNFIFSLHENKSLRQRGLDDLQQFKFKVSLVQYTHRDPRLCHRKSTCSWEITGILPHVIHLIQI